jgi:hypothetical protein
MKYSVRKPSVMEKLDLLHYEVCYQFTAVYNYNKWGKLQRLELERIG